ncbi:MAG: NAD(P)H-dependent oxidoreductase [Cyanobacteria bacterium J06627_8]
MKTILRIDASARHTCSHSRQLGDRLINEIQNRSPQTIVKHRDLAKGVPLLTEAMIGAYNTPDDQRTDDQVRLLQISDTLIDELKISDILLITTPIYNFSIPGALKAYIDLVCRPRMTFRFGESGPVGLLRDRKTYLVITSGGTPIDSDIDFATGYLKHVLGFMGIRNVEVIASDRLMSGAEVRLTRARQQIEQSVAALV